MQYFGLDLARFFLFVLKFSVGRPLTLDLLWERLSLSPLTAFLFWLEFRKSIFWHFFDPFRTLLVYQMYVGHAVSMAEVILNHVNRCKSHDVSSFSHTWYPERKNRSFSLNTVYGRWTEHHLFNVMDTSSPTPTSWSSLDSNIHFIGVFATIRKYYSSKNGSYVAEPTTHSQTF